jgi:multiple sugar transport system ATP-binding protein
MASVDLKNITKKFGDHTVIDNLELEVHDGEFVTLLGPSGCGKSTLLRMIAGLEAIDAGYLLIGNRIYNDMPAQKRKIAMVFQSYALFPHMNAEANIAFGLKMQKASAAETQAKLKWVIPLLHLQSLEKRLPRELSGGQRQRVALARALVLDPEVLLLDEPLSNLDAALREMAMEELKRIHQQVGKTIIYVTHNQVEAMSMSKRIALLNAGKLEQYDTPKIIYDHPTTLFAAQFLGSPAMNIIDGQIARQDDEMGIWTPVGFLVLDRERTLLVESMSGRRVKVGIRPQNIAYTEHRAARRYSDTCIDLTVELVEEMGDRSLIVGKGPQDVVLRFMITREADIKPQQKCSVFIDGRRVHLFDPDTLLNLFNEKGLSPSAGFEEEQ